MNRALLLPILAVLFAPLGSAQDAGPPAVRITSPEGGILSERAVTVQGTVSDLSVTRATIVVNGSAADFDLANGTFTYSLVLAPGTNRIQIVAQNAAGVGRDSVSVHSIVPDRDVKVVMTWDTPTDIDLHVIDPSGEECFYSSRETKIGGQLDHDDTDGFGPETFMLSNAVEGLYVVKTKYYGGESGQTLVKITVVLFEGTPKETRRDYHRLLTKAGEFVEVCSFPVVR